MLIDIDLDIVILKAACVVSSVTWVNFRCVSL